MTILLAGAHHRSGSEMLARMMGALCKRCFAARRWKSSSGHMCSIDSELRTWTNVSQLLSAQRAGLKLLSSGHWALAPSELASRLAAHQVSWAMVHVVRDPFDLVISAYTYHQAANEPWTHETDPAWYHRMSLSPALPPGLTYAKQLRRLNRTVGIQLQAQHSMRLLATMASITESCAAVGNTATQPRRNPHHAPSAATPASCTTLWLEDFHADFDSAALDLLRALAIAPAVRPSLLVTLRRAGRLSDEQRLSSNHVTSSKISREERTLMVQTLEASEHGAMLTRIAKRMLQHRLERGAKLEGSGGAKGRAWDRRLACGHVGSTSSVRRGWWSSAEPVRTRRVGPSSGGSSQSTLQGGVAHGSLSGELRDAGEEATTAREVSALRLCCEACRAAIDPGCLYFNVRMAPGSGPGAGAGAGPAPGASTSTTAGASAAGSSTRVQLSPRAKHAEAARCTLLTSRATFHLNRRSLTGEI